jgi:hypothetical protein
MQRRNSAWKRKPSQRPCQLTEWAWQQAQGQQFGHQHDVDDAAMAAYGHTGGGKQHCQRSTAIQHRVGVARAAADTSGQCIGLRQRAAHAVAQRRADHAVKGLIGRRLVRRRWQCARAPAQQQYAVTDEIAEASAATATDG